jgi:NADPH:quinone reductase-like Zn-dependent oxidoreductase
VTRRKVSYSPQRQDDEDRKAVLHLAANEERKERIMRAIVVHRYGGPEELKWEEYHDPAPGTGEVLVRVAAASINPFDLMRRSGAAKDFAPIQFPGIVGVDVSGTVVSAGPGVKDFATGDRVMAMADKTYAEFCVVPAANLVKIPSGMDVVESAAFPLVATTGSQLITGGAGAAAGQKVLVTGAVGNVGRSAVFTAKEHGAFVVAGVRKNQFGEARDLGADQVVAIDDDQAIANLPQLDAVADTVNGEVAQKLIAKVKPGGVFASVLGPPQNAAHYPGAKVVPVFVTPDAKKLLHMLTAVQAGSLKIPIAQKLRLQDAAKGHAAVANGVAGKVLLVSG